MLSKNPGPVSRLSALRLVLGHKQVLPRVIYVVPYPPITGCCYLLLQSLKNFSHVIVRVQKCVVPLLELLNLPENIIRSVKFKLILIKNLFEGIVKTLFIVQVDSLIFPLFSVASHVAKVKGSSAHGATWVL